MRRLTVTATLACGLVLTAACAPALEPGAGRPAAPPPAARARPTSPTTARAEPTLPGTARGVAAPSGRARAEPTPSGDSLADETGLADGTTVVDRAGVAGTPRPSAGDGPGAPPPRMATRAGPVPAAARGAAGPAAAAASTADRLRGGPLPLAVPAADLPRAAHLPVAADALATERRAAVPNAAATQPGLLPIDGLLDGIVPDAAGDAYGLLVEDVRSGARVAINGQQVFPSASLYKLPVAWLVLLKSDRGELSLDDPLPIEAEDAVEPEPRGGVSPGTTLSVREALGVMLSVSSNAAAHAFLRVIGRSEFNQAMQGIGLNQTRVPDDDQADDPAAVAVTSPADIAYLLRLITVTPVLSTSARGAFMDWLANPVGSDAVRDTLPGVEVLDKTGNLQDASNVAALVQSEQGTAILVVLDSGVRPSDAQNVIAQLAAAAYQALLQPATPAEAAVP